MAKVLRACVIAIADDVDGPLGGVAVEGLRSDAEAIPRSPPGTLGNWISVLAGGEPRIPSDRRPLYFSRLAASAMASDSLAPACIALQLITIHCPTPSGVPSAKAAAAARYRAALRIQ